MSVNYSVPNIDMVFYVDLNNIDAALRRVRGVKQAMKRGAQIGIERFTYLLVEKVKLELINFGLGNSQLINQIQVSPISGGYEISIGGNYVTYVEYGTGIIGADKPHPHPEISWQYDMHNHGKEGWVYKDINGEYGWTQGMKSRPFMYNTFLYANKYAVRTISYYINREIKKVLSGGKK